MTAAAAAHWRNRISGKAASTFSELIPGAVPDDGEDGDGKTGRQRGPSLGFHFSCFSLLLSLSLFAHTHTLI